MASAQDQLALSREGIVGHSSQWFTSINAENFRLRLIRPQSRDETKRKTHLLVVVYSIKILEETKLWSDSSQRRIVRSSKEL